MDVENPLQEDLKAEVKRTSLTQTYSPRYAGNHDTVILGASCLASPEYFNMYPTLCNPEKTYRKKNIMNIKCHEVLSVHQISAKHNIQKVKIIMAKVDAPVLKS